MKHIDNKKKIIVMVIALLIIGLLGASYAFFTSNLGGQETTETITVAGGIMDITYQGGSSIELINIIPDNNPAASKVFTVTGSNTTAGLMVAYRLRLIIEENTFTNNAITYTLESINTSASGTIASSITNQTGLTTGSAIYILGSGFFNEGIGKVHTYKLDIYFPETGENQNENQGKVFKGYVSIQEETDYLTLNITSDTKNFTEIYHIESGSATIPIRAGYDLVSDSFICSASETYEEVERVITVNNIDTFSNCSAQYKAFEYTLTLNPNGATGEVQTLTVKTDDESALNLPFQKTDSDFLGWNVDNNAQTGQYQNTTKADSIFSQNGETINLYSIWKRTVQANFNLNGATSVGASTLSCAYYNTATSCNITTPTITRDNSTIIGWNSTAGATTSEVNVNTNTTISNNVTYNAITRRDVTITFNANGATSIGASSLACSYYNTATGCSITAPTITRASYAIIGWNTSSSATTSSWNVGASLSHGASAIYYAITSGPLLKDAILAQGGGAAVISAKGNPNFANIAAAGDTGLYAMADDYGTSYYYRGLKANLNNNLIFANMQWKIVRINGDGTIRLIYNGTCPSNSCTINDLGTGTQIAGNHAWNTNYNDNKYLGYMYGGANGVASTNRTQATTNQTNSNAKTQLDSWYASNIANQGAIITAKIADNLFCNDRDIATSAAHSLIFSNSTIGGGYGTSQTAYKFSERLMMNKVPSLKCIQKNDRFTVNDTVVGNGVLTYPVGLITADEAMTAGTTGFSLINTTYYLYNQQEYWLMTPGNFQGPHVSTAGLYAFYNYGQYLSPYATNATIGLRPVINLSSTVSYTGSGTTASPYKVV